jgi:hypothetical protein
MNRRTAVNRHTRRANPHGLSATDLIVAVRRAEAAARAAR